MCTEGSFKPWDTTQLQLALQATWANKLQPTRANMLQPRHSSDPTWAMESGSHSSIGLGSAIMSVARSASVTVPRMEMTTDFVSLSSAMM